VSSRIGLLGGSFDPPHNGHLLAAGDAFEALSLDRLIFIPAAVQPLKVGRASATPAQRLRMVELLVDGDERFEVSRIEIDRGGLSYTVDTLAAFSAQWPSAQLFWLIGADAIQSFSRWRQPERIVELATVVVMQRAGDAIQAPEVPGSPQWLASRRFDISSTEIRARVKQGKSIRGFVPDAVGEFIAAEQLYR
jgi:nicotinate-nucleotide adenylyltransferase